MKGCLLIEAILCATVHGFIFKYSNEKLQPDTIWWGSQGMYRGVDAPAIGLPGNGQSFINLDLTFMRSGPLDQLVSEVEVTIFETGAFDKLGFVPPGEVDVQYCCDEYARQLNVCTNPNSIIVPDDAKEVVSVWKVHFQQGSNQAILQARYPVVKTGLHFIMFSRCDIGDGDVTISGSVGFMNPYGYLDGSQFGSINFTGVLSLLYVFLGIAWLVLCLCYWRELQGVQNWISVVLAVALIESVSKYFELTNWNTNGERNLAFLGVVIFFASLKNAAARFLLLVCSLGYGIVKPSLGITYYKCLVLAAFYYVAVFAQSMVHEMSSGIPNAVLGSFLLLPVSAFNVIFFIWTLYALSDTINSLKIRNQTAKLWLFVCFRRLLLCALVIATVWYAVYTYQIIQHKLEPSNSENWEQRWIYIYFFDAFFFVILTLVTALWRPSKNARQYAFMQQLATDDVPNRQIAQDEEEYLEGLSDVPMRSVAITGGKSAARSKCGELTMEPMRVGV